MSEKLVPLIKGMETEAGQMAITTAMEEKQYAAYQCYLTLKEVAEYLSGPPMDDAYEALTNWENDNDKFLRAVAGQFNEGD